ncbi:uncharacterized protein LOC135211145 isoform X2 [Macrobrachium nipponense]|uniref:uncharacterized protein LOC135211145 isoform X2 n=1 Tax=Macrobrachium nipponense TaxID=159736 RepID=UPI0030C86B1A
MDVNNLRHPSAFLKVIEIFLLIIILALYFSQLGDPGRNFVTSVVVGCFLNASVLLTLRFMGYNQIQNTPLELMFYSYYLLGTFISSILLFTSSNGPCIAAGVFGLLLVVVFAAELYAAYNGLVGTPVSFPPETFPPVPPQAGHQQQPPPPQNFPTEAYPPPPTYLNNQMQNVDLGNPFEESHLQQL